MKYILIMCLTLITSALMAGCGGCEIKNEINKNIKSSSFISSLPIDGKIEGFVIASCNKCNLGKKDDKKCSMGIQIGDRTLRIKDIKHEHTEAHSSDGICNSLRIAYVEGTRMMNYFDASYFKLIESPGLN